MPKEGGSSTVELAYTNSPARGRCFISFDWRRDGAQSSSSIQSVCVACVPHSLNGKPQIAEGQGSAGRRPNGHRDFYHNSGFLADGALDPAYAARLAAVIEACDRLDMVVLLQLFYFGQDTVFFDEAGIRAAVDSMVDWVCTQGHRNVILEIADRAGTAVIEGHSHHALLKPSWGAERLHPGRPAPAR
jgi:hypothetical protein